MDLETTMPSGDTQSHDCDFCKAKIEVRYTRQTGHNDKEEYYCPECNTEYHVKASMPILSWHVTLVHPRKDGKKTVV